MTRALLFVLVSFGALLPAAVSAQFTITYPDPITFASPTATNFNAGYVDKPTISVGVTPDNLTRTWYFYIRGKDANIAPNKALSNLQWRLQGNATWNALTTTNALVTTTTGTRTLVIEMRMLMNWAADVPNYYQTNIALRASY